LLELGGYDALASAQGKSLVSGKALSVVSKVDYPEDEASEEVVRERLKGLGYIS